MKIASIVPMKNVEHTYCGDYAMLLAHLKDYYPERRNKNCYTIMDNSLIELGGAVDVETVYKAAKQCKVDEFILPDVFQNADATIYEVKKSIDWLYANHHIGEFRLMAVCQGKDLREFAHCFRQLEQIPEIHCIGIPKVAATIVCGKRHKLEFLWEGCTKDIHLLGCWKNLDELRQYKRPALIRSCDTCIPTLLSTRGIRDAWTDRPEKTIDLLNDTIDFYHYFAIQEQLIDEGLL